METRFPGELAAGRLEFKALKGRAAAAGMARFGMEAKGFVLVELHDGLPSRYEVLHGIWERLESDRAVMEYVGSKIAGFLR